MVHKKGKSVVQLFFIRGNEDRARFTDATAEHPSKAEQGTASTYHANVACAVANDLAVRAQYRTKKVDRIHDGFGFWNGTRHTACWIQDSRLRSHGKSGISWWEAAE